MVTDLEGRRYTLATLLGEGGQGRVYEAKEGRLAVKLLRSLNNLERERLRRCIQAVKRLDLKGLPIASPIAVLRPPHTGYVMHLAAHMTSLRDLLRPPADGRGVSEWYIATGGLRGRLARLASMFDVFARLHGRGLVYGDPSPDNILFSSERDQQAVFLIDPDNLHAEGCPTTVGVFTPGYGAPELIKGTHRPDTLTDAFALAVIAFEVLTLAHPFLGDLVHDGEPELEEAAFQGQLPWVEHSSDTSNQCTRGIPREMVVSPEAKKLFKRMFEDGLKERLLRPGLGEWAGVCAQASDVTVVCPGCDASYYALGARECPWCGRTRPDLILAVFHLWDPDIKPQADSLADKFVMLPSGRRRTLASMLLTPKQAARILRRHVHSDLPDDQKEQPLLEAIQISDDTIRVHNLTTEAFSLVKHTGNTALAETVEAGAQKPIPLSSRISPWYLHFGPMDKLHRAVVFRPMT
jgi:eukaryotic-like serine/threonine-protein kinase